MNYTFLKNKCLEKISKIDDNFQPHQKKKTEITYDKYKQGKKV